MPGLGRGGNAFFETLRQAVALGLVEGRQGQVGLGIAHEFGQRVLHGRRHGEHHELVHLAQFGAELARRAAVADLPAGGVIGFAEGRDDEGMLGQQRTARDAGMRLAVEHDMFVDLVRQQQYAGVAHDGFQRVQVAVVEHGAGGVVREVQHQQARLGRDGVAHALPVDAVVGIVGRGRAAARARRCHRPGGSRAGTSRSRAR